MNIFCGCDPEALDQLAERLSEKAQRVLELIALLRETAAAVTWVGPDADAHRQHTDAMADHGAEVVADLRAAAQGLRRHAWEQERASEADPWATVRAELPGPAGGGPGGDEGFSWPDLNGPRLRRPTLLEDPGPWIGGPFQAEDPAGLVPGLSPLDAPDGGWGPAIGGPMQPADPLDLLPEGWTSPVPPGGWGPWAGGPFMPSSGPVPPPERAPLPEGEEFALDPGIVASAEGDRRSVLGAIPVVGTIQTAMDVHEEIGAVHDGVEGYLTDAGLEEFQPVADIARLPHTLAEPVLGQDSTVGQLAGTLDRSWANVLQTGSEVTDALGEGDWSGAVRAGERGMYRSWGASAELLTITPLPAYAKTGADLLGDGADAVRPVSPGAADGLDGAAEDLRGRAEGVEDALDSLSDSERWYDTRREFAPMPWDPQG